MIVCAFIAVLMPVTIPVIILMFALGFLTVYATNKVDKSVNWKS